MPKYSFGPQITGALLCLLFISHSASAAEFAIASAHPLATKAGIAILKQGGNAFDAAIAVTSTLAVVEPYSSGMGGGGFYLLHEHNKNRQIMLDARERAPLKGHRDMYLDADGNVNHDLSMNGATSAGIPGIPAALAYMQENYGVLPLSQSMARAIQYADEGFAVDRIYHKMANFRLEVLRRYDSSRNLFLRDGEIPELGSLIKQPDLANTLRQLANKGREGFYQGDIADLLVSSVRSHGGLWSHQDLNQYQIIEREPIRFQYGDAKITAATLPSSGGIVLASIFNMLSELDHNQVTGAQSVHQIVEATRRAYRDRAEFMGDTDYVDVPMQRLQSVAHAQSLLQDFSSTSATDSSTLASIGGGAGTDTTHFSITDADRNMVSATLSVNYPFGSCLVADGTGVLLNDEMDDFSASPGVPNAYGLLGSAANAIQPGKRMLSSMTPAFVHTPRRSLISGTPGGSRIITMQLLGMLEFLKGGSAEQIVSLPRFHHQFFPDHIYHEDNTFDAATKEHLQSLGHELKESSYRYGNMQTIVIDHPREQNSSRLRPAWHWLCGCCKSGMTDERVWPRRAIIGFHLDAESHWAADLECGHSRHVRHDPPWQNREWVLSPEKRRERIGEFFICKKCELIAKV